jgi:peptide-methionine (S)-S-oxide reductase
MQARTANFLRTGLISLIAGFTLSAASLPGPAVDENRPEKKSEAVVLAGGCFCGVQAVFDAVKGVSSAISGYAGGSKNTAQESVQVTFDPSQVSFGQLLKIYFSVAHDPTEFNRQGPDAGTQYRFEIFYSSDEQKHVAEAYVAYNDLPKLTNLRAEFPELLKGAKQ